MANMENARRQLNDLLGQRANHLKAADEALGKNNMEEYKTAMSSATALNGRIDELKASVAELDRYLDAQAPRMGDDIRDMAEMGKMLAAGQRVKLDIAKMLGGKKNAISVASGMLEGGATEIRESGAAVVASLVDQVSTIDLSGMAYYDEPYVKTEVDGAGADPNTASGKARTETNPAFAAAPIRPYEVTTTSYVDRNLSVISAAGYAQKVQDIALRGLRRKVNSLILNGDGTGIMYGMCSAKNKNSENIFAALNIGEAITAETLNKMVFAYGGNEEVGGNARLLLSKKSLMNIGAVRGVNEKRRLFEITPDAMNPNTGVISDGGFFVPYTICHAAGDAKLIYGDPANYLLGLFSEYTIRVDESYKAGERLVTVLGDVMVGGNLVVDVGMVVGNLAAEG